MGAQQSNEPANRGPQGPAEVLDLPPGDEFERLKTLLASGPVPGAVSGNPPERTDLRLHIQDGEAVAIEICEMFSSVPIEERLAGLDPLVAMSVLKSIRNDRVGPQSHTHQLRLTSDSGTIVRYDDSVALLPEEVRAIHAFLERARGAA